MRDIEDTIRAGERNRDTMRLVSNWCAHARIEKFGGTGIIEQATGLPIGSHGMHCDFAPEGGFYSWDLRDAVIDYYDRNCSVCTHRKPVTVPNISEIIGERDRARAARDAENARAETERQEALAKRSARRAGIRSKLGPVGQAILDDIGSYDEDRSSDNYDRLTQSARLAPEHFGEALTDYVVELGMSELFFCGAALVMLDAVGADDAKVARIAVRAISHWVPAEIGWGNLARRIEHLEAGDVAALLRNTIHLARPDREYYLFRGDDEPRPPLEPKWLVLLFESQPDAMRQELETMLLSRKRKTVDTAARAIAVLLEHAVPGVEALFRTMISVAVRADSLVDDFEMHRDRLPDLMDAIREAFNHDPEALDKLVQDFAAGATAQQRARIYGIYSMAIGVAYEAPPVSADSRKHAVALPRLIWAATAETDQDAFQELLSSFRGSADKLAAVIRTQLDAFIGALMLLSTRLAEHDATPAPKGETVLDAMARRSRRIMMVGLMEEFVEWASTGARGDEASMTKIAELFEKLPEDDEDLRGMLLGATKELAEDVTGLRIFLPHLYHALVGASVRGRAYAASAIGELPYRSHDNLPPLLFEAFCTLLWDQYKVVHKSAVNAFRRSYVPEEFKGRAVDALLNLVKYYRTESNEDEFLATCVRLLAGMLDEFGKNKRAARRYLVDVAMGIDELYLRSDIDSLAFTLGEEPTFVKLVAKMLPGMGDGINQNDRTYELVGKLPLQGVAAYADELKKAAIAASDEDIFLSVVIVEALVRAGALEEALSTVTAIQTGLGDSVRTRSRRRLLDWIALASRMERALAADDKDAFQTALSQWRQAETEDAEDKKDRRERRSRTDLPYQD